MFCEKEGTPSALRSRVLVECGNHVTSENLAIDGVIGSMVVHNYTMCDESVT